MESVSTRTRTNRTRQFKMPVTRTVRGKGAASEIRMQALEAGKRQLLSEMIDQYFGGSIVQFLRQALSGRQLSAAEAKAFLDMVEATR